MTSQNIRPDESRGRTSGVLIFLGVLVALVLAIVVGLLTSDVDHPEFPAEGRFFVNSDNEIVNLAVEDGCILIEVGDQESRTCDNDIEQVTTIDGIDYRMLISTENIKRMDDDCYQQVVNKIETRWANWCQVETGR